MSVLARHLGRETTTEADIDVPEPDVEPLAAEPDDVGLRLRDLDRRGRVIAGAFAAGVLLGPLVALLHYLPNWVPTGDPAYMGLRAWDVGTARTPLIGQPSTSAAYVSGNMVNHLGASHFYLLAPFMRLLGPGLGMLLVSVLITGGSVLVATWVVYRRLGPAAAMVGAVVLGAITFTTGMASLVNPVSSNIAGYPLLCSAVLLWGVLSGDRRLLPAATVWVSFTAQQHLAVLPSLLVMTAAAVTATVALERHRLRAWARPAAVSAGLALVLWFPVLAQQVLGTRGNLTELTWFMRHSSQQKLGLRTAFRQVVNVFGVPPLLGQLHLDGYWFFRAISPLTIITALTVVGLLVLAAVRWGRARDRRRTTLLLMTAAAAVGGLLNGSSIPIGIEQYRLPFYHWAFVVTLFVLLSLLLLAGDALPRLVATGRLATPWLRTTLLPAAGLLAVVVPAVVNPSLSRESSTLFAAYSPIDRHTMAELRNAVLDERDRLDGPVALFTVGDGANSGLREGLALDLTSRGLTVVHPATYTPFVDEDRLARRSSVQAGLVLVVERNTGVDVAADMDLPGRLLLDIDDRPTFDQADYDILVAQAREATTVRLTPTAERALAAIDNEAGRAWVETQLYQVFGNSAAAMLRSPGVLQNLLAMPLAEPALDPARIRRVLASLPDTNLWTNDLHWRLRLYLLDRDQVLTWGGWTLNE